MHRSHEQALADIEQVVRASGATLDEVDARIAEVLGVPTDYYHAYLLVWGAIEAHTQALDLGRPPALRRTGDAATPARIARLNRRIAGLAARIHEETAAAGLGEAADQAAKILGAVMEQGQALRDLEPEPAARPHRHQGRQELGRG